MKKKLLSLAIILAACRVVAQTADSIPHYNLGQRHAETSTLMEMSDGSLLGGILTADLYPLGYTLHKVSSNGSQLEVSDTLFLPYDYFPRQFTAKDPQGNGNVLAEFGKDFAGGNCYLRIRHFDDLLNFDATEVTVPLTDYLGIAGNATPRLDSNGDILLSYYDYYSSPLTFTFARIGLDGTVKFQKSIDTLRIDAGNLTGPIVFSESPLTYCCWGEWREPVHNLPYVNCYLMDSKFDVTAIHTLPRSSGGSSDYVNYENVGDRTRLMGMDDGCFLVARHYERPYHLVPYIEDNGVAVLKYDSECNMMVCRKFPSEPYYPNYSEGARPIGLERSRDGYIYFAYFTQSLGKESQVSVVKMDNDLNIIWQRHCLDRMRRRDYGQMIVLDDNSVAVTGITELYQANVLDHSEVFYLIVHDDYDALEEQGFAIRPYDYYPNPAQSELHLQYSPDVKPAKIDLFDMQGRLVLTQTRDLESLSLEGLAPGQYLMQVTLEDGKVFTDKVVKE